MTSVESAVSFAAKMIRDGDYPGKAISIASRYYKVSYEDVQKGLASRSGASRKGQKQPPKPTVTCQYCGNRVATWKLVGYAGYNKVWSFYLCNECDGTAEGIQPSRLSKVTRTAYKPSEASK